MDDDLYLVVESYDISFEHGSFDQIQVMIRGHIDIGTVTAARLPFDSSMISARVKLTGNPIEEPPPEDDPDTCTINDGVHSFKTIYARLCDNCGDIQP